MKKASDKQSKTRLINFISDIWRPHGNWKMQYNLHFELHINLQHKSEFSVHCNLRYILQCNLYTEKMRSFSFTKSYPSWYTSICGPTPFTHIHFHFNCATPGLYAQRMMNDSNNNNNSRHKMKRLVRRLCAHFNVSYHFWPKLIVFYGNINPTNQEQTNQQKKKKLFSWFGATRHRVVDVCAPRCIPMFVLDYGNVSLAFWFKQFDTLHAVLSKP